MGETQSVCRLPQNVVRGVMKDEYCLKVSASLKLWDDVSSPLNNSLHFKGFPDNLKAIRNIFFINGRASCSFPGISSMLSCCGKILGPSTVRHNSYTWLGRPEGNNHSCPLLPPSLSCADNEQSN